MNNFNKIFLGFLIATILYSMAGCALLSRKANKNGGKEEAAKAKVDKVEAQIGTNLKDKLDEIATLSYGIGYVLDKESEPSRNVLVARDLNIRSLSLAGTPTLSEINEMKQMIDDLTSELQTEKDRGQKVLELKDIEINNLQLKSKALAVAKDAEIQKYMKLAHDTAEKADALQGQLNEMDSFFGLGAVWYGMKKFVIRMAWILGIGSIIFLILRFASMSNPVAASIFAIFNHIMSWVVHLIKALAPKALEVAGHTTQTIANKYRDVLTKIIDGVETLQERQKAANNPNIKYTLDELLAELSRMMDSDEKAMVAKIKRDIGYNG